MLRTFISTKLTTERARDARTFLFFIAPISSNSALSPSFFPAALSLSLALPMLKPPSRLSTTKISTVVSSAFVRWESCTLVHLTMDADQDYFSRASPKIILHLSMLIFRRIVVSALIVRNVMRTTLLFMSPMYPVMWNGKRSRTFSRSTTLHSAKSSLPAATVATPLEVQLWRSLRIKPILRLRSWTRLSSRVTLSQLDMTALSLRCKYCPGSPADKWVRISHLPSPLLSNTFPKRLCTLVCISYLNVWLMGDTWTRQYI